ncbi:condensation domain-containing protein [Streptomyces decoyicus]|uniref:Condensation domain-containing protein n=1 Tax=Streptomyces decoyicus TaxID=249567 RepID=A0ABZ1FTF4_9ACTN|nr:condensation domain-containing protein [Streptomyces decoyicus]WSB73702.1 condensation domain-containing protein [Streptomyces decoyicus]
MTVASPTHPIPMGSRQIPMSHNQLGRIALASGSDQWRKPPVSFGLRLKGPVRPQLLHGALTRVVQQHTALRTYFPASCVDGSAECLNPHQLEWPTETIDLRQIPQAQRAHVEEAAFHRLQEPFAPDRYPLFRALLMRYEQECSLSVAIDHLVFDGASVGVFLDEFGAAYRQLSEAPHEGSRERSGPGEQGSDFSEFSTYERDWLVGAEAQAAFTHWKKIWDGFGPFPTTRLPIRTERSPGGGAEWKAVLPARNVLERQRSFPHGYISLTALAASAVVTALRDVTGQDESGLLHPSSRRFLDSGERMIGYLNNRVLLRVPTPAQDGFLDIADRTRSAMLESLEHDMMPFEVLLDRLAPQARDRRPDQPYVHLNVEAAPAPPELPGLDVSHFWPPETAAYGDLPWISVDLEPGDELMVLRAGYSTGRYTQDTVSNLMNKVRGYLTEADGNPT